MSVGDRDLFVRIQPWYIHAAEGSGESGRTLSEWNIRVMGIYGITRETTLFVAVPFIDREWREGGIVDRGRGIGDVEVLLRRTFVEKNWARRTFSVSPFVGISLSTGSDDAAELPAGRTLGSGSMGYLIGFAARDATFGRPHRFLSARYKLTTSAGRIDRGDEFEANAAIKPGLASWTTDTGEAVGVNGMLELNFEWQGEHHRDGQAIADAGGNRLSLTPGVVYTRHRWILEAAVRIPVVQNLRGDAPEDDYSMLVGVWRNF
jgi:hypothetical protein